MGCGGGSMGVLTRFLWRSLGVGMDVLGGVGVLLGVGWVCFWGWGGCVLGVGG